MKAKVVGVAIGAALVLALALRFGNDSGAADDKLAYESECARLALSCETGTRSWEAFAGMRR